MPGGTVVLVLCGALAPRCQSPSRPLSYGDRLTVLQTLFNLKQARFAFAVSFLDTHLDSAEKFLGKGGSVRIQAPQTFVAHGMVPRLGSLSC